MSSPTSIPFQQVAARAVEAMRAAAEAQGITTAGELRKLPPVRVRLTPAETETVRTVEQHWRLKAEQSTAEGCRPRATALQIAMPARRAPRSRRSAATRTSKPTGGGKKRGKRHRKRRRRSSDPDGPAVVRRDPSLDNPSTDARAHQAAGTGLRAFRRTAARGEMS